MKSPDKVLDVRRDAAKVSRFYWWSANTGPCGWAWNTDVVISHRSLLPCGLLTFSPHAWHKAPMRRLPLSKQYHVSVWKSLLSTRSLRYKEQSAFKYHCQDLASVTLAFSHWRNFTAALWQRWCFRNFTVQSLHVFMISRSFPERLLAGTREEYQPN